MDKLVNAPQIKNAPCLGMTDRFFVATAIDKPGPKKDVIVKEIKETKAICSGCDHRMICLAAAVDRNEQIGIWGGYNFFNRTERKEAKKEATDANISPLQVV